VAADLPGPFELVERPPDRDQADTGERGQLGVAGQHVPGRQPALGHQPLDVRDHLLIEKGGPRPILRAGRPVPRASAADRPAAAKIEHHSDPQP